MTNDKSLKVMRVSQPSLAPSEGQYFQDTTEEIDLALAELSRKDLTTPAPPTALQSDGLRDFGLSDILTLPSSFGTPYLGETFTAYLCVNNESIHLVPNVALRVELQTTGNRFVLFSSTDSPIPQLEPSETTEAIVSHEIKELGVHVLSCTVTYEDSTMPPGPPTEISKPVIKTLRKFYKFQVLNPLAVKTKVNAGQDALYLEVQVQNTSVAPMLLERMIYEPASGFTAEDVNTVANTTDSVFAMPFLDPLDIRQYLYVLRPTSDHPPSNTMEDMPRITTNALGKLDIAWRTSFGEFGRLQTSQLTRKAPPPKEAIEIQPIGVKTSAGVDASAVVALEEPFNLMYRCSNTSKSPRDVRVSVIRTRMGSLLWVGNSSIRIGTVDASSSKEFEISYLPLNPGLQRIGSLKVTDDQGLDITIETPGDVFVDIANGIK